MSSDELLGEAMSLVQEKSVEELKETVIDINATPVIRSASAILLIRSAKNKEDKYAGFPALDLFLPMGITDTESNWSKNYPVAAELVLHPELMPEIIQQTIGGSLSESVVRSILIRYQRGNYKPSDYLNGLLESDLSLDKKRKCERLLAILKGEMPPIEMGNISNQSNASKEAELVVPVVEQTEAGRSQSLETISDRQSQASEGELPPSKRWPVVAVAVTAALGLVWVWLKRRKLRG